MASLSVASGFGSTGIPACALFRQFRGRAKHTFFLRELITVGILTLLSVSIAHAQPRPQEKAPSSPDVPVVKGDSGYCTADFVVHDGAGKGIYNAKITLHVEYGFLGVRKLDLSVTTNSDGKARVEGLPEKPHKAADFQIAYGTESKTVAYDPFAHCMDQHEVTFGGGGGS